MAIPGIELTERPWTGSADSRLFARDPGPGNPNVGRESLRAPAPPTTQAGVGRLRRTWDAFTGNTSNFVGPQQPASKLRTAGRAIGGTALGVGMEGMGVARVANDEDTTGIDVATQVAEGTGKLASAALGAKAGGMIGALGGPAAPLTVPLGAAIGGVAGYYGGEKLIEGGRSLLGSDADSPAEQVSAHNAAARDAPPPAPAATPAAQTNDVIREGNSYRGGNVSGNITINGFAPGAGLNLGSGPNAQNMAAADNLAQRETLRGMGAALHGMGAAQRPVPQALQAPGNSDNSWQARNNLRNLEVSASSIYNNQSPWGDKAKGAADIAAYQNARATDAALRAGTDPGSQARTNAAAAMYGDDVRADTAQYTSDNSLRGQLAIAGASRASNAARLRYDADKDARDLELRSGENELKREENRLKRRAEAEKNMTARIAAAIPPGPNNEPDTAAAAEQVRAMTARMADRQRKIEADLARNPDDEQAQAELANIRNNGLDSVEFKGMDNFQTGMEAKSLRRDNAGWAPWKGKDVKSNKPITSLRRDEGLFWDDYVDDQGGRIPAGVIDDRREQFKYLIQK